MCATPCAYVLAREQAAAEGRVRDDRHTELTCGTQDVNLRVLDVKRERRVLDLDRGNWVDGLGAPERRSGDL